MLVSISPEYFAGRNQERLRGSDHTKILAIANNKGGVGKTTTAYYLGAEIARHSQRVLLIDLDGQGNLTERCIPEQVARRDDTGEFFPNIVQYFAGERTLGELIISAERQPLSLIPSDPFLTLRDLGGSGRPDIELRFVLDLQNLCVQPIASLGGAPDWVIIDTPPALSAFTRAGLAAADHVLAPVRPRPASLAGTANMLRTLRTMNALMGADATFLGAVVTHGDDLALTEFFINTRLPFALKGTGGRVFDTKISIDNQLDMLEPGAKTPGAKAYAAFAEEVMQDVNARERVAVATSH
jgi:chromosome partitioning protein